MLIHLHSQATTTPKVRAAIQASDEVGTVLAERFGVTPQTIYKWRKRDSIEDRSHTPHRLQTTLTPAQEAVAVALRKTLLVSLDDLLAVVREFLNAHVSRSGLDRCLRRHGVGNLRDLQAKTAQPRRSGFKAYEPGYLHIDVKYLPQMADETSRRYLFVAIDRATRWVFIRIFKAKTAANARRFLRDLERACPIRIRTILTDNGKEFTDRLFGLRKRAASGEHEFDRLCTELGIEHRLTPPKSPQTNGMVERFNGRIEEVLQSHHFRSGEELETTLHRYVWLYNQQLPQSALGSKSPLQAMKDWHKLKPQLFRKQPYYLPGCDTYMPISGFTAVDLGYQKGDVVSNFVTRFDDPAHATMYLQLFDQIWSDSEKVKDVTAAICEHIESVYQENSPERIYFMMLYNIFHDFLDEVDEDVLPNDLTGYQDSLVWNKLFNYQKDAATGIINKLETYNGCILADSVGLGKTFTALAVIKYYELRNRSVLVLCPKKLADNWRNYNTNLTTNIFAKDRFNYDVLAHTDLSRTSGESFGIPLNRVNWGNYDLVVIDESHNFRNNDVYKDRETRYQKLMNKVIRAGVKTKVLMLSATPVNNRFTDLRNQLALAYEGQSEALSKNLKTHTSIEEIFRRAQKTFNEWSSLPPEERTAASILKSLDFDFFELLDAVTIARSRKHIETFYDTKDIGKFPQRRKPLSFHRPITERSDVMGFNDIFTQLSVLKLAVYAPISYILPSRLRKYEEAYDTQVEGGRGKLRQADRERSLQALMTTNLLKRLESSVAAFRLTLRSLGNNIARTLDAISEFERTGRGASVSDHLAEISDFDPEDDDLSGLDEFTVGKKVQISLGDMDLPSWKHDLAADLALIDSLIASMDMVKPADDAKLQHLLSLMKQKISEPLNPGNRKIIVFTAFADTARYLFENLAAVAQSLGLHVGQVTGSGAPKTTLGKSYDFQSVLTLFSPRSKEKAVVLPNEPGELDILIGTDCISEGQNLQDCDFLINYDIHWNPVRIIQRFGRIDRIGSPNSQIQLVNYWPDISLDEYINLKERVENRMVIADVTATGDDNVLTAKSSDIAYRKEQLKRMQEEVIELEDVKAGISITDLGLNDFRMDLLGYVKEHGPLDNLPFGMHAVAPAQPELGLRPGVIFALRNIDDGVNVNQQNRLHPFYLVYIDDAGQIVADHTEVKRLLDLIRTSCKGRTEPIRDVCRIFNERTEDGRRMGRYSDLLSQAIRSMIEVKEERDIDSLFSGGRTTALTHTIKGLDDFELIVFLVIEGGST